MLTVRAQPAVLLLNRSSDMTTRRNGNGASDGLVSELSNNNYDVGTRTRTTNGRFDEHDALELLGRGGEPRRGAGSSGADENEKKNSAIKLNPGATVATVVRGRLDDDDAVIELSSSTAATIEEAAAGTDAIPRVVVVRVEADVEPRVIDEGLKAAQAWAGRRREAEKDGQEASSTFDDEPTSKADTTPAPPTSRRLLAPPTSRTGSVRDSAERRSSAVRFSLVDESDEQIAGFTSTSSLSRQSSYCTTLSGSSSFQYSDFKINRSSIKGRRIPFRHSTTGFSFRSSKRRLQYRMAAIAAAASTSASFAAGDSAMARSGADGGEETVPSSFLRTDSIIIRIKPGQCFSDYSNVVVDPPARCDPRLGTLGELRHHLSTGTKQQVKRFLRQNNWTSGHRIRSELWKELCHDNNSDAQRAVYRDIVEKLGTVHTRPAFLAAPGVVLCDHQLKENGRICLLRLLTAIEHQRPDFTYVPVLYPLGALFLHYMNEEEAFACIMNLISQSQKFLIQTDIATAASKRTMLMLVKKHVNRAYVLCKRLAQAQEDKDLVGVFDEWKCWIFRDLPFSHLVRVVDCFLFEGQKVLFRVALAIVHLWSVDRSKEIRPGKKWTAREIGDDIAEYCKKIKVQPPKLLKTAFGIRNLKMSTVHRLQQKHELTLRHSNSGLAEITSNQKKSIIATHHYIDLKIDSNVLDHNQAMQLISWLPSRYQLQKPTRLFSTNEDGTSLTRLWTKLESHYPTILVIRTSFGEIFGAFCSAAWDTWKRQSGTAYFGTGETFLFRFPNGADGEKFSWVGTTKSPVAHCEELFQTADLTTLVVGGGNDEGLSIRQSLESGSSGHCATFNNPVLSSKRDFQIQALEAFGFVPDQ